MAFVRTGSRWKSGRDQNSLKRAEVTAHSMWLFIITRHIVLTMIAHRTKVVILATTNKGDICLHSSQGSSVPADETLPGFHPRDFTCETSNGCMYCSKAKFEARFLLCLQCYFGIFYLA
ncbi:unnamed protein product [Bubo scandiacus]|uniref:Uncharacterized protein n=1 Tax=Bubo bubo TaxID=30461 RepID=A0A8C0ESX1_BUBBB